MIEAAGRLGPLDGSGRIAPPKQTRLASFVILAHQTNARLLQGVELMPFQSAWHEAFHRQYWREIELIQLLLRATAWTPELGGAARAMRWQSFWSGQVLEVTGQVFTAGPERAALTALALGHAVHSVMRLSPLLPEGAAADDAFVAALRRVDEESDRIVEAQASFLAGSPLAGDPAVVEAALADKRAAVDGLWQEFLQGL